MKVNNVGILENDADNIGEYLSTPSSSIFTHFVHVWLFLSCTRFLSLIYICPTCHTSGLMLNGVVLVENSVNGAAEYSITPSSPISTSLTYLSFVCFFTPVSSGSSVSILLTPSLAGMEIALVPSRTMSMESVSAHEVIHMLTRYSWHRYLWEWARVRVSV